MQDQENLDGTVKTRRTTSASGPDPGPAPDPDFIDMARIQAIASSAADKVVEIRSQLLKPNAEKIARSFSGSQLAVLCGVDQSHLKYRISKNDLPPGEVRLNGSSRQFSLAEARAWTRTYRSDKMRPAGQKAIVITTAMFKGGVAKTTTTMTLAQGLSLRGHKVLAIDLDPQGSMTFLSGVLPEADVNFEETAAPLFLLREHSIDSAIQSTYWDGLDLVASAPFLFQAEFALPAKQLEDRTFRFWEVLKNGIEAARSTYDVILIDTAPSLSYVTINGLFAADGLVLPIPPSGLDFASSSHFWSLLGDLGAGFEDRDKRGETGPKHPPKTFEFLRVLLSRVDPGDVSVPFVRQWIQSVYGEFVMPVDIPKTSVTTNQSTEFGTVYDVQRYGGSDKTFKRAIEAYDRMVELFEQTLVMIWKKRAVAEESK
jgi:chromosome partitioning protein